MPKSQAPRKPYRDKFQGAYRPKVTPTTTLSNKETDERTLRTMLSMHHGSPKAMVNDRKTIGAEAGSFSSREVPISRLAGHKGKLVAAGVGTTGAGALLAHRRRSNVDKLFNPYSGETVEFSKTDIPPTGVRSVTPKTKEGAGVAHGNKLLVMVKGSRSKTPPKALVKFGKSDSKPLSSLDGASSIGHRGTPMGDVARSGRVGHRLTLS